RQQLPVRGIPATDGGALRRAVRLPRSHRRVCMRASLVLGTLACSLLAGPALADAAGTKPDPSGVEKGTVRFEPRGDQKNIPERYRLDAHTFDYELTLLKREPRLDQAVYHLRFPSPVVTPCPENNTVHADYYRPRGDGPFPGV